MISILFRCILLFTTFELSMPFAAAVLAYVLMNLSRAIFPIRVFTAAAVFIASIVLIFPNHEKAEEHASFFEIMNAAIWAAGIIIPMSRNIHSSLFSAVFGILTAAASIISCRCHVREWRNSRQKYSDYGSRTKEELLTAAADMCTKALYEDIEEGFKEEIRNIKREAEGLLSSGVYDLSRAKELYTRCRMKIKGAEAYTFMHRHSGTEHGSFQGGMHPAGQMQRKFFAGISTEEALDKKFRELAKTMHPDNGGDAVLFSEMQKEYRELKESDLILKKKNV